MAQVMLKYRAAEMGMCIADFFIHGDVPPKRMTPKSVNLNCSAEGVDRSPVRAVRLNFLPVDPPSTPVSPVRSPVRSSPRTRRPRKRGRPPKSAASRKNSALPSTKTIGKPKDEVESYQKTITEFFPVRRSDRRGMSSAELKKAREKEIEEKIMSGCEDGLQVIEIEDKGRGVVATKEFNKDDFVVEYAGELVSITTAKQREQLYEKDKEVGCYMYYFTNRNKQYCIDATAESGKLGRLLNHSRKGNCHTKVVVIDDTPYLVLLASRHIARGQELTYDYGDRSQSAIESHPWLKS